MKLSEVRPCDNCGGKIAPIFYVARVSQAMFMPRTNQVLAMTQYLGGNLVLGEMFSGDDDVVKIMGDEIPELWTKLFLCQDCAVMKSVDLASLMEKVNNRKDKSE